MRAQLNDRYVHESTGTAGHWVRVVGEGQDLGGQARAMVVLVEEEVP